MRKPLKNESQENFPTQKPTFLEQNYFAQAQKEDMSLLFGPDYIWELKENFPLAKCPNHFIGLTMQMLVKSSLVTMLTSPDSTVGKEVIETFASKAPDKKENLLVSGLVYAILLLAKSRLSPHESKIALEAKRRIGIVPIPLLPKSAENYLRRYKTFPQEIDICSFLSYEEDTTRVSLGFILGEKEFKSNIHYPANLDEKSKIKWIHNEFPIAIEELIIMINSIDIKYPTSTTNFPPNPLLQLRPIVDDQYEVISD